MIVLGYGLWFLYPVNCRALMYSYLIIIFLNYNNIVIFSFLSIISLI